MSALRLASVLSVCTAIAIGCAPESPPPPPVDCTVASPPLACLLDAAAGDPDGVSVVAYGTSLTADGAWFDAVAAELERQYPGAGVYTNAAESARSSAWGLTELDARVLVADPDLVLMEFAVNDAYVPFAISVDQSEANLRELVSRIQAARPAVRIAILITNHVVGASASDRPMLAAYYQRWRDVTADLGLTLIEENAAWLSLYERAPDTFLRLVPDGIHPSLEGHHAIDVPIVLGVLRGMPVDVDALVDSVIAGG